MQHFSFEPIDTEKISQEELEEIYQAETDGIGTLYGNCGVCLHEGCNNIQNKEDTFLSIDKNYKDFSVAELFVKYGDNIKSLCHNAEMKPYRGRDKIETIKSRLSTNVSNVLDVSENPIESFCIMIKNEVGKTIGMSYGNITNSLEELYEKDLSSHFTRDILSHKILKELKNTQYFLMLSGTFILEKYIQNPRIAISLLKNILKNVALSIDDKYLNAVGIYENIVGSASQRINERAGGKSMKLYEQGDKYYIHPKFKDCDITIHHNTVKSCREIKS